MYLTLHKVLCQIFVRHDVKEPYMSMARVTNSRSNPPQAACLSIYAVLYTCMTEVSSTVM